MPLPGLLSERKSYVAVVYGTDWERPFVVYEHDRSAVLFFTTYGWNQEEFFSLDNFNILCLWPTWYLLCCITSWSQATNGQYVKMTAEVTWERNQSRFWLQIVESQLFAFDQDGVIKNYYKAVISAAGWDVLHKFLNYAELSYCV